METPHALVNKTLFATKERSIVLGSENGLRGARLCRKVKLSRVPHDRAGQKRVVCVTYASQKQQKPQRAPNRRGFSPLADVWERAAAFVLTAARGRGDSSRERHRPRAPQQILIAAPPPSSPRPHGGHALQHNGVLQKLKPSAAIKLMRARTFILLYLFSALPTRVSIHASAF